jgi:hypothetical protein
MSPLFYVRLDDARDVRRTLLETSKAAIHCLRSYQDLVRVRGEKAVMLDELRRELRELTVLLNRLEKMLPTMGEGELAILRPAPPLPALSPEEPVVKKGRAPVPAKRVAAKKILAKPETKIAVKTPETLADRLARIERTLNTL